jgi:riboflavin kinase/FMN adenylyltransferase
LPARRVTQRGRERLSSRRAARYFPFACNEEFAATLATMRIIRHPGSGVMHQRGAVLAMGNFDGLHKGHAALIDHAKAIAKDRGAPTGVLTFEPHPRCIFIPDCQPFRLTPFRVKQREIARLGVDYLFIQHFDRAFAAKSAESFIEEVMVGAIGIAHIVVGQDCTFGNRRRGTPALLREVGAGLGFGVTVIDPVRNGDIAYSSTRIRELLQDGKPREAAAQLGRFWEIDGHVTVGDQRGRTIGFPTANLGLGEYLRPCFGVYAVRVIGDGPDDPLGGQAIDGVANIGLRPTVSGTLIPRLEVHLFDINRDLYGRHLRVALVDFIRPEKKFASFDELKGQIVLDAETARKILADTPRD